MVTSGTADASPLEAIVIGGSAGALPVLKALLRALPAGRCAPLFVVLHVRDDRKSLLVEVLGAETPVRVLEPEDKQAIESGHLYVAPPGYHLLVEDKSSLALSLDRPEHFSRPSIDVLFESAARVFGKGLLGVLLSGASADGAAGLRAIHEAGGVTLVQAPSSAHHPTMPQAALSAFAPSLVLAPPELADTLAAIAKAGMLWRGVGA